MHGLGRSSPAGEENRAFAPVSSCRRSTAAERERSVPGGSWGDGKFASGVNELGGGAMPSTGVVQRVEGGGGRRRLPIRRGTAQEQRSSVRDSPGVL